MKKIFAMLLLLVLLLSLVSCETVKDADELGGMFSGARWAYAGRMTLMGLGTVFFALAVLFGVLSLFRVFMYDIPNKRRNKAAANATAAEPVPEEGKTEADQEELAAVIAAAVAATIAGDEKLKQEFTNGFRVVSFKRSGK